MDRSTETEMKVYREHIQSLNRRLTFQGLELTKLNRAVRRRNNKIKNLRLVIGKLKAELQQERA